jgi:hypothetical protein
MRSMDQLQPLAFCPAIRVSVFLASALEMVIAALLCFDPLLRCFFRDLPCVPS